MELAVSILNLKEPKKEQFSLLLKTDVDFIHLDLMDGSFVPNVSTLDPTLQPLLESSPVPIDIHFMVSDVEAYVKKYAFLHPRFMTFHLEAVLDPLPIIHLIRSYGLVGISIKPDTDVEALVPYLDQVDLVLVMSVEPGMGGQTFLSSAISKLSFLKQYREEHQLAYLLEVDGGINPTTISNVLDADLVVVGSFITKSDDLKKQIQLLKEVW